MLEEYAAELSKFKGSQIEKEWMSNAKTLKKNGAFRTKEINPQEFLKLFDYKSIMTRNKVRYHEDIVKCENFLECKEKWENTGIERLLNECVDELEEGKEIDDQDLEAMESW